jgi:hypothetical protein
VRACACWLIGLGSLARDADARAFTALLGHLKKIDAEENTVLMVQVENEVGMLPVARDYSPVANQLFAEAVPDELVRRLAVHEENWTAAFGAGDTAAEAFSAWSYAQYVEALVKAGKEKVRLYRYR